MKREPVAVVKLYKRQQDVTAVDDRKSAMWAVPWGMSILAALTSGYWIGVTFNPAKSMVVLGRPESAQGVRKFEPLMPVSDCDAYKNKCRRAYLALKDGHNAKAFQILDE